MDRLLFSDKHLWLKIEDDTAEIGICDYLLEKLGTILFLNLPDMGSKVVIGDLFGDIEGVKTVQELISPLSGTVLEVNQALQDDPSSINEAPYETWFVKVKADTLADDLMDKTQYGAWMVTL